MQASRASRVHLTADHSVGYRRSVLFVLLTLTIGFGAVFVILNLRIANYGLALTEAVMVIYAAFMLRVIGRTERLQRLIVAFLVPFFAVMMYAFYSSGADPSIYCWALALPVLSYVLLGRTRGFIVAISFLAVTAVVFFLRFGYADGLVNINSIANVLLCAASIMAFAHVHELSRARNEAQLQRLAVTDPLTGLANREWFRQVFEVERRRVERSSSTACLLVLDLDHFKHINDSVGHDGGDDALCFVADVLRSRVRAADTVCRMGGEEFVVLLPDTPLEIADGIADDLRTTLEHTVWHHQGDAHRLTVSIGVAELGADGRQLSTVFGVADKRLYHAKQAGRNRVVASTPD